MASNSFEKVKTGLAVVGAAAVAASIVVTARQLFKTRRNERLRRKLAAAEAELESSRLRTEAAEAKARAAEASLAATGRKRRVRVYIDGCFDMLHFGHSNALRQARAHGTELVVGLIGDDDIVRNKGSPPVMPFEERLLALEGNKFVDQVIPNAPYDLTPEWTRELVNKHHIDLIVHGDDPCISADGNDCYATAKKMGVFKTIKRTEGISTTDIVGRMLLMNREHHVRSNEVTGRARSMSTDLGDQQTALVQFLPTSNRIVQFSSGKAPKKDDIVVYVAGAWDLFNAGHVAFLEKAKSLGDFLLVGIHDDQVVNQQRGSGFPILNLHERTLSVLSCKFVDEVIIGAPWTITSDMIKTMHIQKVVQGTISDRASLEQKHDLGDPYEELSETDVTVETVDSPSSLTAVTILERVLADRNTFQARYDKKKTSQTKYEQNREFVEEA